MINGLLAYGGDPHAYIRPAEPGEYDRAMLGIEERVEMIGGYPVVQPMHRLPGEVDGLHGYDVVLTIDGRPADALEQFDCEKDSAVKIEVLRDGVVRSFAITSESFERRSVASERIDWQGQAWGYIRIGRFSDDRLCVKLKAAISDLEAAPVNGLVVDVRGNSGGYLDQAVCAAGLFVGKQVITLERKGGPEDLSPLRAKSDRATGMPLVVLIDNHTGSAAEIFAGAMRSYERGWLVGETSYGKGAGQKVKRLAWPLRGIEELETIAWYFQPNGTTHHLLGLAPDFPVELAPGDTDLRFREIDWYPDLPKSKTNGVRGCVNEDPAWREHQVKEVRACVERLLNREAAIRHDLDAQLAYSLAVLSCTHGHGIDWQRWLVVLGTITSTRNPQLFEADFTLKDTDEKTFRLSSSFPVGTKNRAHPTGEVSRRGFRHRQHWPVFLEEDYILLIGYPFHGLGKSLPAE